MSLEFHTHWCRHTYDCFQEAEIWSNRWLGMISLTFSKYCIFDSYHVKTRWRCTSYDLLSEEFYPHPWTHLEAFFTSAIITVSGVDANLPAISVFEKTFIDVSFAELFVFVCSIAAVVFAITQLGHWKRFMCHFSQQHDVTLHCLLRHSHIFLTPFFTRVLHCFVQYMSIYGCECTMRLSCQFFLIVKIKWDHQSFMVKPKDHWIRKKNNKNFSKHHDLFTSLILLSAILSMLIKQGCNYRKGMDNVDFEGMNATATGISVNRIRRQNVEYQIIKLNVIETKTSLPQESTTLF